MGTIVKSEIYRKMYYKIKKTIVIEDEKTRWEDENIR